MAETDLPVVLIVDDSEFVLELYSALLEETGWKVETRTNPFVDAAELSAMAPDVVLLDLGIPGVEDGDLPFLVRSLRGGSGRHVVLHSGRTEDELRQIAGACGADGYLCKSGDETQLLDLLESHRPGGSVP